MKADQRLAILLAQVPTTHFRAALSCASVAAVEEVDFVIRDAQLVDGTGAAPRKNDLAVTNGRIAFVGPRFDGIAKREFDGSGRCLAPGFIDIHTHFDPQLCWDGRADPSLKHGVTTVVTGNCSLSLAPARDATAAARIVAMFGRIEDIKKPTFEAAVPFEKWSDFSGWLDFIRPSLNVNVGALIGHSVVRLHVMGKAAQERVATKNEIDAMCHIIGAAMVAGAIGVSTSYADIDEDAKPVPSRWANLEERVALATAMGRSGRGVWQVVPELSPEGTIRSIREMAEISRRAKVLVSFQPVLSMPFDPTREEVKKVLDAEAKTGARVYGQVTPRDFNMNVRLNETAMLLMGMKDWDEIMNLPRDERLPRFADAETQSKLVKSFKKSALQRFSPFLKVGDVQHPDNQKYLGRTLKEIADEENQEIGKMLLDISIRDKLNAEFRLEGALNADKDAINRMLEHPLLQVGASDAGAHITQFCGTGDTTYLLKHLVKTGLMPIEKAVQLITGDLARAWGIHDRGTLECGQAADLVLIDMERLELEDQVFVHDVPGEAARYTRGARGFDAVFVNGTLVLEKDEYVGVIGACGHVV